MYRVLGKSLKMASETVEGSIEIDLCSLGGLLLHLRRCDDALENSCFQFLQ